MTTPHRQRGATSPQDAPGGTSTHSEARSPASAPPGRVYRAGVTNVYRFTGTHPEIFPTILVDAGYGADDRVGVLVAGPGDVIVVDAVLDHPRLELDTSSAAAEATVCSLATSHPTHDLED